MSKSKFLRYLLSLTLVLSIFTAAIPQLATAQTSVIQPSTDLTKALETIESKTDARRKELGIPGMSLAIVKDGKVIFAKGLGFKDFEKKIPVTPDTQFAIGSATKAFTALSVLMSADEGKVDLDASPRQYLPYFKMQDPETDKNMTVRDLLDHSSGLNRTDLAMITGKLTRQELIQVVGGAKPMAKLREKFFYNNIMFAAAGEVVAQTQKTTWEKFVPERIFKPLGMTNSTMDLTEMQKAKDYSLGYEYNFDTKETRRLPFRSIDQVAPAGAINSSARDMTKWLDFVMNGGSVDGKRLVSEKNFDEWTKKQMNVTPNGKIAYGLGWFVREWNGMKVLEHGGNIDGFNALVAMIPEKKLGFVMLTNVSGSSLGSELMPIVWENILGNPNAPQEVSGDAMAKEVGKYRMEAAGFDIEVKLENGKLVAVVPNQPTYALENVGGRKYRLAGAPDGFFATFKDDSMFLEQPQGNYTLPKAGAPTVAGNTEGLKELIGKYQVDKGAATVEIKELDGKVALVVEGQQPYFLAEKSKDVYRMNPLPDDFSLKVKRSENGKVAAIVLVQPQGEPTFNRIDSNADATTKISVDELMAKSIEAIGGEANWRKIKSRVMTLDLDIVNQGMRGSATTYSKFPNKSATETSMTALGKVIAKGFDYFDGTGGQEVFTFSEVEKYSGKRLEDARINNDILAPLNWKTNYKTVEVKGIEKVGEEECWAVEFTPEKGTKFTDLYSVKTFLLLKRRGVIPSSTSDNSLPYSIEFSDYREVDGIKISFRSLNSTPTTGEMISTVKTVKHNVEIDDKMFAPRKLKF
ncbi:MAG: serine hydrolase [Acidobacteria bacterium]|nr:serine hydrolase [Acidobacteriota bacterium]